MSYHDHPIQPGNENQKPIIKTISPKGLVADGFELCHRSIVKYPQCNATANLFGGQLLSWIDESTAIFASKIMNKNFVVTAHFGGMDFKIPVELRKIVTIYAKPIKLGKKSLTIKAIATKSDAASDREEIVAETEIVFVSVNSYGESIIWNSAVLKTS